MTVPRRSRLPETSVAHDVPFAVDDVEPDAVGLAQLEADPGVTRVAQSQTGEKTLSMRGARIGLGSIFSPCVTANAAAVPPSNATTSRVESKRGNAPRV